jgi:N6-L-threonylcarbamoyladenine synthase
MPTILAIESSCDETAAAIIADGKIRSNIIATQDIHQAYGGVIPELASRAHLQHIVPVVDAAMQEAGIQNSQIDAIAFTEAPGLVGALLVGAQFAKSLAQVWQKPLIAVHHMQAHVLANLIQDPKPSFPFLCLTVSGGHTQIVQCNSPLDMHVIGETIDDAAGEAFDKAAKMLGLPYPGGPLIDQYAQSGNQRAYSFPEPQISGLNFSFSGLKTAILYFLRDAKAENPDFIQQHLADICASIQSRIVTILLNKLKKASLETGIKEICIAGGVSANKGLRAGLTEMGKRNHWNVYIPPFAYCTDNAGMIAMAAHYKYLANQFASLDTPVQARAEWH